MSLFLWHRDAPEDADNWSPDVYAHIFLTVNINDWIKARMRKIHRKHSSTPLPSVDMADLDLGCHHIIIHKKLISIWDLYPLQDFSHKGAFCQHGGVSVFWNIAGWNINESYFSCSSHISCGSVPDKILLVIDHFSARLPQWRRFAGRQLWWQHALRPVWRWPNTGHHWDSYGQQR